MKRILSLMLVLLLLFSAGCKQQDADPATPGEVVEKTETETPETDLPEVVEQEETPSTEENSGEIASTDTETEQKPSAKDETEDQANNSTSATNTEDDFDKEAWLKNYLPTAEIIYDYAKKNEYTFSIYVYLEGYNHPVAMKEKLDTIPDFSSIGGYSPVEVHTFDQDWNRQWSRVISIGIVDCGKEKTIEKLKEIVSLDFVQKAELSVHDVKLIE